MGSGSEDAGIRNALYYLIRVRSICFAGQTISCRYQARYQLNIQSNPFWTNLARIGLDFDRFGGSFTINSSFGRFHTLGKGHWYCICRQVLDALWNILMYNEQPPWDLLVLSLNHFCGLLKPFCFLITIVILGHLHGTMHVGTMQVGKDMSHKELKEFRIRCLSSK